ncbi:MAG: hypothetical protein ACTSWD_12885, partial [Candidatus Heimdallarchaeota archaeon]
LVSEHKKYMHVDAMVILGTANRKTKAGYPYKNRGLQMGYKFKSNSLRHIAETMGVETQKGDIDYDIFHKNSWTTEETSEIQKYLKADVLATKEIFDKMWDFWLPFTEFVDEKYVYDLSWLRNSIASLTYKSACKVLKIEPSYCDKQSSFEEMGGRVIEPKYEEATKVWYIDFASLYPHIMSCFNLFSEVDKAHYPDAWNGGALFKTRGYYDVSEWNPLSKAVADRLTERDRLKKEDKDNPMIYTLKIFLNALYGVVRSSIFEKVHTPNAGWDCCWLGQQIQEFTEDMMKDFGFETIAGDTDSLFVRTSDESKNNIEYVKECLADIVEIITDNMPFSVDTFKIDIENYIEYIMFPFSVEPVVNTQTRAILKGGVTEVLKEYYEEKEEDGKTVIIDKDTNKVIKKGRVWEKQRIGKKKNYLYVYKDKDVMKTQITGLPIKKDNSAPLAMKIYREVLEPRILSTCSAKFERTYIDSVIDEYLQDSEVLKLLAVEYKVNAVDTYKKESQIQAQISKGYFDGRQGVIRLIKNAKVGNAGKGMKYCTIEEAIEAKLTIDDIDLEKVNNELAPFVIYEPEVKVKKEIKVTRKVRATSKSSVTRDQAKKAVENRVIHSPAVVSKKADIIKKAVKTVAPTLDKPENDMLYLEKDDKKTLDWD